MSDQKKPGDVFDALWKEAGLAGDPEDLMPRSFVYDRARDLAFAMLIHRTKVAPLDLQALSQAMAEASLSGPSHDWPATWNLEAGCEPFAAKVLRLLMQNGYIGVAPGTPEAPPLSDPAPENDHDPDLIWLQKWVRWQLGDGEDPRTEGGPFLSDEVAMLVAAHRRALLSVEPIRRIMESLPPGGKATLTVTRAPGPDPLAGLKNPEDPT